MCDLPEDHFPFWNDGLKAALDILKEEFETIDIFNKPDLQELIETKDAYDLGIFWMALTNPLANYRVYEKQMLLFAGGPTYHANVHNFDSVVAESRVDLLEFRRFGLNSFQAFGTNTKLFRVIENQPKIFSYTYPAAFAKWKHHEKFAKFISDLESEYTPVMPSLAFGYMQPGGWEKECYEICQQNGIAVMPQVSYDVVPWILNASETIYVAADAMGGCQRTVLEAKACGRPVIIDSDSQKLTELEKITPEEVRKDWSEVAYAKKLKKGIEELCQKQ